MNFLPCLRDVLPACGAVLLAVWPWEQNGRGSSLIQMRLLPQVQLVTKAQSKMLPLLENVERLWSLAVRKMPISFLCLLSGVRR